jgi:hypothetical protein
LEAGKLLTIRTPSPGLKVLLVPVNDVPVAMLVQYEVLFAGAVSPSQGQTEPAAAIPAVVGVDPSNRRDFHLVSDTRLRQIRVLMRAYLENAGFAGLKARLADSLPDVSVFNIRASSSDRCANAHYSLPMGLQ